MIVFLYGQDSFRSRLKLREIIDEYRKVRRSGLNLFYYDFQKDGFIDFKERTETISMFAEKKLIVLENVLSNPDLSQRFLDYLKNRKESKKDDILIFFETNDFKSNNALFAFLIKTAKTQEFKPLFGHELGQWIKKEAKDLNTEISPLATEKLVVSFGNDLWGLSNEIKKLASFKNYKKIEPEDIDSLTKSKIETNIFKTIDAIAALNRTNALKLAGQHLEKGDSAVYLLAMINYQFRNILSIKDLCQRGKSFQAILKSSKLNPFVARKCYLLAQKFTFSRLKKIYSKILETDLKIKTGKVSPRQGLELLISEI
jgi:DNA polymerase-3 subunit delta